MVCGKLHICHEIVLDQHVDGNAYSTPLLHEALYVDHKMVMLVIGLYHSKFLLLCVKHQNYPEHDTLCLFIFFYWLFLCLSPDQRLHVYNHHYIDVFGII